MNLWHTITLLAEGEPPAPADQQFDLKGMMPGFVIVCFLFYFLMLRPQAREQKGREAALSSLKKNDRVVTFSGIIGTVVSFSSDNKEVTLRSDEAKFRVLRSAIQGVLAETSEEPQKPATT